MSATTFTLIGIGNKFFTLLLNVLIWDKHASTLGIVVVCVCLLAGVFYQQTPKRADETNTYTPSALPPANTTYSKDVESLHSITDTVTDAAETDPLLSTTAK